MHPSFPRLPSGRGGRSIPMSSIHLLPFLSLGLFNMPEDNLIVYSCELNCRLLHREISFALDIISCTSQVPRLKPLKWIRVFDPWRMSSSTPDHKQSAISAPECFEGISCRRGGKNVLDVRGEPMWRPSVLNFAPCCKKD